MIQLLLQNKERERERDRWGLSIFLFWRTTNLEHHSWEQMRRKMHIQTHLALLTQKPTEKLLPAAQPQNTSLMQILLKVAHRKRAKKWRWREMKDSAATKKSGLGEDEEWKEYEKRKDLEGKRNEGAADTRVNREEPQKKQRESDGARHRRRRREEKMRGRSVRKSRGRNAGEDDSL